MLKGLLVRQAFVILDVSLALLVAGLAFLVILRVYDDDSAIAELQNVDAGAASLDVAQPESRDVYARIVDSGLFGPAARGHREEPEPEPDPEPVDIIDHGLPLRLLGTAAPTENNPLATAAIENSSRRTVNIYYTDDVVMDRITLAEVYKRRVVLYNEATNERLVLKMDDDEEEEQAPVATARADSPRRTPREQPDSGGGNEVVLDRNEVVMELAANYGELVDTIQPELYYGDNGEVAGVTARNIGQAPIAERFDLREGDVIQTVNGIPIDSEDRIAEIVQRFGELNVFRVGILRNGQQRMMTYRLE